MGCCGVTWGDIAAYREAMARWRAAGKPRRWKAGIEAIFSICAACPEFDRIAPWRGRCKVCRCYLGRHKHKWWQANKIALATEHCPLGKW